MNDIAMYETFEEVSNEQIFFEKIFIKVDYPFSEVKFKKEDFVLATKITALKFLGGFNYDDDENRKIFLNNRILNNSDLFI